MKYASEELLLWILCNFIIIFPVLFVKDASEELKNYYCGFFVILGDFQGCWKDKIDHTILFHLLEKLFWFV